MYELISLSTNWNLYISAYLQTEHNKIRTNQKLPLIKILIVKFLCRQPEHDAAIWAYNVLAIFVIAANVL